MKQLAAYSDDDLLGELVRRRNSVAAPTPEHLCDDCRHFVVKPDADHRYNPCSKRHKMQFHVSDHPLGDGCGYYRNVCPDREVVG